MSESLTQWLMSETPASRRQAVLGNAYRGFLAFVSNPAALAGLFIVAVLILMAIFAPTSTVPPSTAFISLLNRARVM